jgi:uncharacterized protein YqeY
MGDIDIDDVVVEPADEINRMIQIYEKNIEDNDLLIKEYQGNHHSDLNNTHRDEITILIKTNQFLLRQVQLWKKKTKGKLEKNGW